MAFSGQQTNDGGYIIAGSTVSFGVGSEDVWLVKTDPQGEEEWRYSCGGSGTDNAQAVGQTADGGYILAGLTSSYGAGGNDLWLIRVAVDTSLSARDPRDTRYPRQPVLFPCFPNPFNPVSTIRYDTYQASEVLLVVYDIVGREVVRLVDSYMEPGSYQTSWDGRSAAGRELPSGIYIACLATPEYNKSIKMVVLR
jgi:hypothetical protein